MSPDSFQILDASSFPLVSLDSRAMPPGSIEPMIAEFEALLLAQRPFILLMTGRRQDGDHEEQKRWVLWLKENRSKFAATCRLIIVRSHDDKDPSMEEKQLAGLKAMLGIDARIVRSDAEAEAGIAQGLAALTA